MIPLTKVAPTGDTILLVSVPEDAYDFLLNNNTNGLQTNISYFRKQDTNSPLDFKTFISIHKEGYDLLGTITNSVVEFDCSSIVEGRITTTTNLITNRSHSFELFRDYSDEDIWCVDSSDSFLSFLRREGVPFENKYGKEKPNSIIDTPITWLSNSLEDDQEIWQAEEDARWKKIIVLKINSR